MLRAVVGHKLGILFAFLTSTLPVLAPFQVQAANVTLAWNTSQATDVVGYNLYYGPASGTYTNIASAGSATNITVANLVPGATYYFAATAYDSAGLESIYSAEVSYMVPSGASNQPPTLNPLPNVVVLENAGTQSVSLSGISSGSTNEAQTLVITATSGNPSLIPNPAVSYTSPSATGTLSFTPSPLASGTTTITVTVNDGGVSNNTVSQSFTVTVLPVNQPPTLNTMVNLVILENAGVQTVNLSGISSGAANENQTLTVTASSSNPSLVANPAVSYTSPNTTGTLTFTPVAFASGTANITVTVNDGGASNNIVSKSFTVTVTPVNQTPTLNSIPNLAILENATVQTVNLSGISSGAANENQTLTVTASSSNPSLIANPSVSYTSPSATGTLSFTPAPLASGTTTITVTVNDGGVSNNTVSQSFTVTVLPVNQPPTLNTMANLVILENAGVQTVNLSGISSGAANENQTLTVTASSSNPGLVANPAVSYTSPNTTGTLTFTPVAFASGTANITVTVNDGGASNNVVSQSFTVTVIPVNQPPSLDPLSDLAIVENAGIQNINLSGISSGASNEIQTLTVTAASSNPALVPAPSVSYTSPQTSGQITFTPVPGAFGIAMITVTVNDGGSSNNVVSRTFTVTVDQPPTISAIADQAIAVDTTSSPIPFSIADAETTASNLVVSATSSNPGLVSLTGLILGGNGTNRTIALAPLPGQIGSALITISVSDGLASTSTGFHLSVEQRPIAPLNLRIRAN